LLKTAGNKSEPTKEKNNMSNKSTILKHKCTFLVSVYL